MAHALDGTLDKSCGRPAPARMHCGNSTPSAVQKQNGNAIGGSDSYTLPDLVRDQGVTFGVAIAQWVRIQNLI
jgi:hypothetical protein